MTTDTDPLAALMKAVNEYGNDFYRWITASTAEGTEAARKSLTARAAVEAKALALIAEKDAEIARLRGVLERIRLEADGECMTISDFPSSPWKQETWQKWENISKTARAALTREEEK